MFTLFTCTLHIYSIQIVIIQSAQLIFICNLQFPLPGVKNFVPSVVVFVLNRMRLDHKCLRNISHSKFYNKFRLKLEGKQEF
jgi:hypothetical protein